MANSLPCNFMEDTEGSSNQSDSERYMWNSSMKKLKKNKAEEDDSLLPFNMAEEAGLIEPHESP